MTLLGYYLVGNIEMSSTINSEVTLVNRVLFSCFVKLKHVFMCLAKFQKKYTELHLLGEGGFGSVFAGYRQKDKLPVAIKHIPKENVFLKHKVSEQHHLRLTLRLCWIPDALWKHKSPLAMVSLLDWYELEEELLLVMERPMPSEDLFVYLDEHEGENLWEPLG
uniref:non-specific serine/threonine protein kinase n=1 Tax=Xiphophorus maculatus TaxID=8083 RepID=A0A3B5QVL9_XIPMA